MVATEKTVSSNYASLSIDTSERMSPHDELAFVSSASTEILRKTTILRELLSLSEATGGYVLMESETKFLPYLRGSDGEPVYLYNLVEVIEEVVDFDEVLAELPTLTFSQVAAAVSFLRKVAQINSTGADIDSVEDQADASNPELIEALRNALNEEEGTRVFSDPQQD
jgi:hypothetical protein